MCKVYINIYVLRIIMIQLQDFIVTLFFSSDFVFVLFSNVHFTSFHMRVLASFSNSFL
jgi:hypothetical protein